MFVVDLPFLTSSRVVQDALKRALASDLDFKGSYYYEATHLPAVNPILRLKDAGRVGLPLTEQAAKRVISHCRQAPFGQGERTVIDTSVRDTWEMDAADVGVVIHAFEKC